MIKLDPKLLTLGLFSIIIINVMALPLPENFAYTKAHLEKAFHLGIVFSNQLFVEDIYNRLNYIQFMGRIYDNWALTVDLQHSFCQNYLILVASLIEALIRGCYSQKLAWCEAHCFRGGTETCPFATKKLVERNGHVRTCPTDELGFKDLLDAAEVDGMLRGLDINNLNTLRKIRNQVHIDSTKNAMYGRTLLNAQIINSYLKDLKILMKNVYDWIFDHNQRCEL